MTYKVTEADIFEDNPELTTIDEYKTCTSRQLKYVFLAYDYKGPYRRLKPDDRKRHAAIQAGYKAEKETNRLDMNARNAVNGNVVAIERAIKYFLSTQYDEDRETLAAIKNLIMDIKTLCNKKDKNINEMEKAVKLAKDLPGLEKTKKELQEIFNLRDNQSEDEVIVKDEIQLSTLDELIAKQQNA